MQISRTMIRKILYSGTQATNSFYTIYMYIHRLVFEDTSTSIHALKRQHRSRQFSIVIRMPSAHTRVLKRYSHVRIPKREMGSPRRDMLSGRTANGALARWRQTDFLESRLCRLPIPLFEEEALLGPGAGNCYSRTSPVLVH